MKLHPATEEEFNQFLKDNPLAVPDGFAINGSYIQTTWVHIETREPLARESSDSQGILYDIAAK